MNLKYLFRKKKLDTATPNPYLNARRSWNLHIGSVLSLNAFLAMVTLLALCCALVAISGNIRLGMMAKFIPLVFQQDANQNLLSVTVADKMQAASLADYRKTATDFISNVRLVTPDATLQRKAIFQTYAFLAAKDPATVKVQEFLTVPKEAHPMERAKTEMVSVEIKSVIKQSPDSQQQATESWQVDWVETVRNRDGTQKQPPTAMRALVTLYQGETTKDTDAETLTLNPHMLMVKDFNWAKQL
ncbi:hypothetical protein LMG7143_04430 [Ralstonia thomasii]|jgi:type IV secretory pathway TrbF-like protein|nr:MULTISPECIES: VirB8/TrbF family protein [Ralstonia]MBT2180958.1 conjugal transfer protein TrbF [Ralstonia pickettii]POH90100.1 conjugal transfer protein TrbF [Ralstonia pickettii]CAJ0718508.1 hypothetical protein LMG7143_04430 [Ralstonia sp. LMG 18095]